MSKKLIQTILLTLPFDNCVLVLDPWFLSASPSLFIMITQALRMITHFKFTDFIHIISVKATHTTISASTYKLTLMFLGYYTLLKLHLFGFSSVHRNVVVRDMLWHKPNVRELLVGYSLHSKIRIWRKTEN